MHELDRRGFIKLSALGGTGLLLGVQLGTAAENDADAVFLVPLIQVDD